jgi:hypothetical protein
MKPVSRIRVIRGIMDSSRDVSSPEPRQNDIPGQLAGHFGESE